MEWTALSQEELRQVAVYIVSAVGCGCTVAFGVSFILFRLISVVDELGTKAQRLYVCKKILRRSYGDNYSKELLELFLSAKTAFPSYPDEFILECIMGRNSEISRFLRGESER